MASLRGFEGFEVKPYRLGAGLTIGPQHARSGVNGMGLNTFNNVVYTGQGILAYDEFYAPGAAVGFAFRASGAGGTILQFVGEGPFSPRTNLSKVELRYTSQGALAIYSVSGHANDNIAFRGVVSRQLDQGSWYYIVISVGADCVSGPVAVQLNGGETVTIACPTDTHHPDDPIPTDPEPGGYYPGYHSFRMGVIGGGSLSDRIYSFDDIYWGAALGEMAASKLTLEADRRTELLPSAGSDNYAMVDDATPDGDATYLYPEDFFGGEDVYECVDVPELDTVWGVQMVVQAKRTANARWRLQGFLELDGDLFYENGQELRTTYGDVAYIFPEAPGPVIPVEWTPERLSDCGFGLYLRAPSLYNEETIQDRISDTQ